jgi:DNA-binding transcriptional ArsR family regulator
MASSLTDDCFMALARPERRHLLELLTKGERRVSDLVESLGRRQPHVSKQLGVLRKAGLVRVRRVGRQQLYRLNAEMLKPVHEWVQSFERFWQHQLDAIKARAEANAKRGQD